MQASLLFAIAAAGSVGAVVRHLSVGAVQATWPGCTFAIAAVNLVGCFGFGLCLGLWAGRWSPMVAAAVLTGFFGAFTTFSSFAAECHAQLAAQQWGRLLANVLLQNLGGIAALAVGLALGKVAAGSA